ncbi:hypothetical protein ABT297_25835 [Dactylosporangium sp. NPDC000555]|uniref:hypothetical protein n=1 Tax=Dactylosporangium sp. NPDC000555 TaxID=3154260 RepID=UPI00332497D3
MNCRTQVLLTAGVGYLLGRQHKLRWGLVLGAAAVAVAVAGRVSGSGGILQRGVRALSESKELGRLAELGAPLVSASKDAARAAVTGQIESVTGRLRERADLLRQPVGGRRAREAEPEEEEEEEERARPRRRPPAERAEYEEEERSRRRPRAARPAEEEEDEYDEPDDEEREAPSGVARSRPEAGRPPVRRRGR